LVEHSLGKGEVISSILIIGSRRLGGCEEDAAIRVSTTDSVEGGSNLRRFAGVTLSIVEGESPQPKSRAILARDLEVRG
jgi:hypothetical protein